MSAPQQHFTCNIDDGAAPLLVYSFSGKPSDPNIVQRTYLDYSERNYIRFPAMAEVLDMSHMQLPSPVVREYITAWMAIHFTTIRRHCLASATVVRSVPMRWILAGWFKIQPPPAQNYRAFSDLENALAWAAKHLRQGNVEIEPARFTALQSRLKYQHSSTRLAG